MLEGGKDPGLGVRALHERGITGKGVNVGIVDQALGNHIEYEGKVRYYDNPNTVRSNASMHGGAVLSILAGDTVGVAPDVKVYYACNTWGDWKDGTEEFYKNMFIDSIHHLLDLNETLPEADKMSVISVSRGFDETMEVYQEVVARAESQGVWLLTCNLGADFAGADRAYGADSNDRSVYGAPYWWDSTTHAFVPMNRRTTAAPNGGGSYAHYVEGGWSWATPYIAGVYALAKQVDPDLTPEQFIKLSVETATPANPEYYTPKANDPYAKVGVLNPAGIIEALEK